MCGSLSWIRNKIIYIKLNERKCISLYFSFHSKQILEMDDTKKYLFNPMLFFIVKRVSLLATVKLKYKKKKKLNLKSNSLFPTKLQKYINNFYLS